MQASIQIAGRTPVRKAISFMILILLPFQAIFALDFPTEGLIIRDSVRIRAEPDRSSVGLGKLDQGQRVAVYQASQRSLAIGEIPEKHQWYRVIAGNSLTG